MGSYEADYSVWADPFTVLGWTNCCTVNGHNKVANTDFTCGFHPNLFCRFLAAEFGLKGKNNLESAHIDEIVDTIEDVINVAIKTHFETDPAKKAETIAQLNKSTILPMLANIEKRLASRGGQFLVGNALSLADIHLFFFCSEYTTPQLLSSTPKIANLVKRVEYLPNIQKWLNSRPISKL